MISLPQIGRRWSSEYTRTLQQPYGSLLQLGKRCAGRRGPYNKNKIVARRDRRVLQPHRLAHAALDAIAIVRLAEFFADDETAAGAAGTVASGVQQQQRVRPCCTMAPHPLELFRPSQPLAPSHDGPI